MNKIKTAVIGAGKMGKIHAKVCANLQNAQLIAVVDSDKQKADQLAKQYNCKSLYDHKQLKDIVDAVTIATPTIHHCQIAKDCINAGLHILIEKPLAASSKQGQQIVELAKQKNVIAAVGHSERCNPVAQAMKRLNIEPRFIESNRISPYSFRSTDIGVVLDVMIHDIDIILSLAASPIKEIQAVGVNVIANHEDICNARIVFENGCIANITASRLALKTERKVRVFSKQAYLSVDYFKKDGVIIQADPNINVVEWIREKQKDQNFDFSTVNWPEMLHIENLEIDDREPLKVEQESFLSAICDQKKRPEVTAEEGLAAMKCAEKILQSIKNHQWK